jgi:hypothetical protein
MVRRPEARQDTRSLPARAHTMVLWAPDTAGPWSAVTIRHISINLVAYFGNLVKIHIKSVEKHLCWTFTLTDIILLINTKKRISFCIENVISSCLWNSWLKECEWVGTFKDKVWAVWYYLYTWTNAQVNHLFINHKSKSLIRYQWAP